jgi:SmpA/OmlA family protein
MNKLGRITLGGWVITVLALSAGANAHAAAYGSTMQASARVTHADGTESRFYTSGPAGTGTLRVDLSPNGEVLAKSQVLRDEVFQRLQPGLTAEQVFEIIGPPTGKTRFENTKTTAWDYHYRNAWGYDADFSVIVDDANKVVGKFSNASMGS